MSVYHSLVGSTLVFQTGGVDSNFGEHLYIMCVEIRFINYSVAVIPLATALLKN